MRGGHRSYPASLPARTLRDEPLTDVDTHQYCRLPVEIALHPDKPCPRQQCAHGPEKGNAGHRLPEAIPSGGALTSPRRCSLIVGISDLTLELIERTRQHFHGCGKTPAWQP